MIGAVGELIFAGKNVTFTVIFSPLHEGEVPGVRVKHEFANSIIDMNYCPAATNLTSNSFGHSLPVMRKVSCCGS